MKMMLPRSRRRLTHPMSTAFLPASDARRAPHIVVRFKSPKKSSKVCLSEESYQPSAVSHQEKTNFCLSFRTASAVRNLRIPEGYPSALRVRLLLRADG